MVPERLKPQECKRVKLCKPPPVPYVSTKDEVQDEVARMQSLKIKMTIKKDTTLNFAVWQENGTREAFLMHVTAVLNAIKKHGHVKDYEMAAKEYEGAKKAIESAKAGLALLDGTREKGKKSQKKKTKEVKKDATAKAPEPESDTKEAEVAPTANDEMKASFLEDLEKAKQTCSLRRVSTLGTRSSASRGKVTHTSTYKVTLWNAQGECCMLHLTIA